MSLIPRKPASAEELARRKPAPKAASKKAAKPAPKAPPVKVDEED